MSLPQKIFVTVKANAKETRVERVDETHFSVKVSALPVDGKANKAVTKALADFLHLAPSRLTLEKGATSKVKRFVLV